MRVAVVVTAAASAVAVWAGGTLDSMIAVAITWFWLWWLAGD